MSESAKIVLQTLGTVSIVTAMVLATKGLADWYEDSYQTALLAAFFLLLGLILVMPTL